jgi:PKD repeat protein
MGKLQFLILVAALIAWEESEVLPQVYTVRRVSVDSQLSNEFSPVFYKDGIVFCSDMNTNSLVSYRDESSRVFKIVYSARKDSIKWQTPSLFSRELTTDFNDGPVTFNKNFDRIYYTRNNNVGSKLKNISDTTNKLGIYSAALVNGKWTEISPFKFNDPEHTFCTPALSPDSRRIYFSSNMPGGYGGMDLYYCDSLSGGWDKPVNLGPVVNSQSNESFPFACRDGNLYFASEGHSSLGGKDIFYTRELNGAWLEPVRLDSAINSKADDFGIVMDSTLDWGYFSTNRRKSDDIFVFRADLPEFSTCDSLREGNYCFTFYDKRFNPADNLPVSYLWDFGDNITVPGAEARHCFPGPGSYTVKLSITDNLSGKQMAPPTIYHVKLQSPEQPVISSWDTSLRDSSLVFSGSTESLADFKPESYLWDFGSGFHNGSSTVTHRFTRSGTYQVRLGLTGGRDSLGKTMKRCVLKTIRIFDTFSRLDSPGERICTQSPGDHGAVKKLSVSFYAAGNIGDQEKQQLVQRLGKQLNHDICFGINGLTGSASPILEQVCKMLKADNSLSLSISVRNRVAGAGNNSASWAGELAMFLRNSSISKERFSCRSLDAVASPFGKDEFNDESIDGYVDFCFIRNN